MLERIASDPFRGAWRATALITITVTLVSGLLMTLTDHDTFPTLGSGLWWAAQTVTTIGYGDVVPTSNAGKALAVLVMMGGVSFIAVTTAAIASAFVEAAHRRWAKLSEEQASSDVARLESRIEALTAEMGALRDEVLGRPADPRG